MILLKKKYTPITNSNIVLNIIRQINSFNFYINYFNNVNVEILKYKLIEITLTKNIF